MTPSYDSFLASKVVAVAAAGFVADVANLHLFDWQRDTVTWALERGRAALFEDTGLGKSRQALEWADQVCRRARAEGRPGTVILLTPLAVGPQFVAEAVKAGIPDVAVRRSQAEVTPGISVVNYENLHNFDAASFDGVVLDESSILKAFSGATKQRLCAAFARTPYRLCCTATPAPNDHLELGNHAEFLGVMTSHEMIALLGGRAQGELLEHRRREPAQHRGRAADRAQLRAGVVSRDLLPVFLRSAFDDFGKALRAGCDEAVGLQARIAELEAERDGFRHADGDGTDRLVRAIHGRAAIPRDFLGGSQARMLHEGADRIVELEQRVAYLEAGLGALDRTTKVAGSCVSECASWSEDYRVNDCDCGYYEAANDAGDFARSVLAGEAVLDGAMREADQAADAHG